MENQLSSKVAIITGGSDGLGSAAAMEMARQGAKVAICARGEERLEEVRAKIAEAGGDVIAIRADVSKAPDLEHFVESVADQWGRIDVVVNNAGTHAAGSFADLTDEALFADLEQKLFGAIRCTRYALPHLKAAGGGSIVNVLGMAAKTPGKGTMPTSISRAAGLAFTKALSKDLGEDNIRVNAICIGVIESGMYRRRAESAGVTEAEFYSTWPNLSTIPLGRFGKAEEFGSLVAYLASDAARFISGTAINLDGGMATVS
jgi:NAD(P)-dependent dehydrogenase (short-subunit alcohol dehydrogenase family)